MEAIYWIILFVVLVIIEFATLGLTTIWFAAGALSAAVLSLFGFSLPLQLLVFFILSVILFFATRPLAVKYLNNNRIKTNVDSLIGMTARVTNTINNVVGSGNVIVNGQEWTARSEDDDDPIDKDSLVTINRISGVKLIVSLREKEVEE